MFVVRNGRQANTPRKHEAGEGEETEIANTVPSFLAAQVDPFPVAVYGDKLES